MTYPISIIVGGRGSGKTWYSARVVKTRSRVLVVDPKSVDPAHRAYAYEEPYGGPGVRFFDGPLDLVRDELVAEMSRRVWTVVFRSNTPIRQVIALAREVGDLHLHIDELNWWRDDSEVQGDLARLLQVSRGLRVSFSCCSQRPQDLVRRVTELADELVIFKVTGPLAIEYLQGFDADIDVERIKALPVGEYVRVSL